LTRTPVPVRLLAFVLVVLAVPASLLVRRAVSDGRDVDPLHSGPAPAFTQRTLEGETVSLAALRGRPVIVNFWGSWCLQCREQLPILEEAARRHPDVITLGILFRDRPEDARQAAQQSGAGYPMLLDPDETVARAYGVRSAPVTFFIAPDGTIAGDLIGPVTAHLIDRLLERVTSRGPTPPT
jgi:cytochrome c biogenesis protein CcmG, thiol:disulfide interchange protein DsbE